jgi:cytochrome c553
MRNYFRRRGKKYNRRFAAASCVPAVDYMRVHVAWRDFDRALAPRVESRVFHVPNSVAGIRMIDKIAALLIAVMASADALAQTAPAQSTPAQSTPSPSTPSLAANPDAAKKKVAMCIGCHGIPYYQTAYPVVYHVPKIGGQSPAYIVAALHAYKSGDRTHPSMQGIAKGLSDEDMADVAAYYAAAVGGAPK